VKNLKNEIVSIVNFFKRKRKFNIENIEGIKSIPNSQVYYGFINKIYNNYNSKVQLEENIQLSTKYHYEANQIIDHFRELFLSKELKKRFQLK